jgi:hypothetical protein
MRLVQGFVANLAELKIRALAPHDGRGPGAFVAGMHAWRGMAFPNVAGRRFRRHARHARPSAPLSASAIWRRTSDGAEGLAES